MGYRRNIKESTRRMLYARSGNMCAMYGCNNVLINENTSNISEICHIEAVNDDGVRYNDNLTDEEVNSYDNLVLLCPRCHPFDVVHVDSHADLGLGDASWSFLQSAFLTLPIDSRRKISEYEFCDKIKRISIGDYLLWAVAYRMVSSITYCANPHGDKNDYVLDTLKDFHEEYIWDKPIKNYIQLKYNKTMEIPDYDSSDAYKKKYLEGAIKDPEVELLIIPTIEDVKFDGKFDYAVMAQSPNYTPASADFILDIFREYIEEI